jgi:hypothetical protein
LRLIQKNFRQAFPEFLPWGISIFIQVRKNWFCRAFMKQL